MIEPIPLSIDEGECLDCDLSSDGLAAALVRLPDNLVIRLPNRTIPLAGNGIDFIRIIDSARFLVVQGYNMLNQQNAWIVDITGKVLCSFYAGAYIGQITVQNDRIIFAHQDDSNIQEFIPPQEECVSVFDLESTFLYGYNTLQKKSPQNPVLYECEALVGDGKTGVYGHTLTYAFHLDLMNAEITRFAKKPRFTRDMSVQSDDFMLQEEFAHFEVKIEELWNLPDRLNKKLYARCIELMGEIRHYQHTGLENDSLENLSLKLNAEISQYLNTPFSSLNHDPKASLWKIVRYRNYWSSDTKEVIGYLVGQSLRGLPDGRFLCRDLNFIYLATYDNRPAMVE